MEEEPRPQGWNLHLYPPQDSVTVVEPYNAVLPKIDNATLRKPEGVILLSMGTAPVRLQE